MSQSKPKMVSCPTCQKPVAWIDSNDYRPFCSERCKLIDFGDWAMEKNSIPGEPVFPPEDDEQDLLQ
jgi:uncharacterized protein